MELVSALPLNGGTYSSLLQCTGKVCARVLACMQCSASSSSVLTEHRFVQWWAAVAAILSFLSYVATAVVAAASGMHYLHLE